MPIPIGYVKNVCCIGQGSSCCRYLILGAEGFACAKVIEGFKDHLDHRAAAGDMVAQGDNCPGWSDEQPDP